MKKENFIKSTIILIIGGAFTKIFGMFIRIVMTRLVGDEGISLYMLVFPTFSLFMTISQLGFPIAISKLISEDKYNNKSLVFSIIFFSLLFNLLLIILILILAPFISNKLLNDSRCYFPILSIALVLPFDSLSSIIRGYFFGKQKMIPHVISHIFEQIVRFFLILFLLPLINNKSIILSVSLLIAVNMISEFFSILILFLFIPKSFKITKNDIKPNFDNVRNVLDIALPTTGGRLIGSISYFLEPVLISFSCKFSLFSYMNLITEYGIIEGYIMPLLLLPGFFTNAISSALLPIISNLYSNNKREKMKKKITLSIVISLIIGITYTLLLILFPDLLLKFLYNTSLGSNYIFILAPIFIFYYIQSILAVVLQAINKSRYIMFDNFISVVIRSLILFFGSFLWGIYGFLLSICINILVVTFMHYLHVKKYL